MKRYYRFGIGFGAVLAAAIPGSATLSNLGNLRVGIYDWDDPANNTMAPRQSMGHNWFLGYWETRDQIRLAFDLWQSILPDMNWRMEDNPDLGNYFVHFRNLSGMGGYNTTNGISINGNSLAGNAITFIDNRLDHDFLSWAFNPNLPHWAKKSNPSACQTLPSTVDADTVKWSEGCVHFPSFPRWSELYGSDLVGIAQHELGHSLMAPTDFQPMPPGQGGHTQPNGVTINDSYMYWPSTLTPQQRPAWTRRPIYEPNYLVRRKEDGFSMMFPGNGNDHHALRGIFPIDAHQLANEGYRVTFPNISGVIVLRQGPAGAYALTSNWDEARNLMIWPNQGSAVSATQAAAMYFLVDVFPRSQTRKTLAAGETHSLAIREDGSLWAWGANDQGQLGDGTTTRSLSAKKISNGPWVAVTAGQGFSLGIRADGSLWAWGDNSQGQLGDPAVSLSTNQTTPRRIGTANDWLGVSAGALHVVAIKKTGKVYGWGYNGDAELGIGNTTTPIRSPTQACPSNPSCQNAVFVSVSAGSTHTLALDKDGAAWGWGSNLNLQLTSGVGNLVADPALISVSPGLYRWSQVEAGHEHSSGLSNGRIYTWGKNDFGQLGQGFTGGAVGWPSEEANQKGTWASLFSGHWHTGGHLWSGWWNSWGYNSAGQLGNNSTQSSSIGVETPVNNWAVGAGRQQHTLGLRRDGTLWGWGTNSSGELGTGGTAVSVPSPVKTSFTANTLTGAVTTYPTSTTVHLTSVGTVHWVKWNTSTTSYAKATLGMEKQYKLITQVYPYQLINATGVGTFGGNALRFSWDATDEVNGVGGTNDETGISVSGTSTGRGFQFTVPARQVPRVFRLYVGAYRVRGRLVARFSDNSTAAYTNTDLNSSGSATVHTNGMYAITFSSTNPKANLIVEWTVDAQNTTSGSRFVTLRAATIN